jgi:RNA polymerase sigma-70 factor (ECF subfamily)
MRAVERLGIQAPTLDDESIQRIEELVDVEAYKPKLLAALEQLSINEREAVQLRVIEELDYKAVAHELGCSVAAARVRVHRGLSRLNTMLEALA